MGELENRVMDKLWPVHNRTQVTHGVSTGMAHLPLLQGGIRNLRAYSAAFTEAGKGVAL